VRGHAPKFAVERKFGQRCLHPGKGKFADVDEFSSINATAHWNNVPVPVVPLLPWRVFEITSPKPAEAYPAITFSMSYFGCELPHLPRE